jgi:3',5'-cyclic-nucleotide phosphodiesterase
VVSRGRSRFAISGDTGPTEAFWKKVNATRGLKALLVELSFPDELQDLAALSGHLTPATLSRELAKLTARDLPVLLYHLKPSYAAKLRREVARLKLPNVRILEVGDTFDF